MRASALVPVVVLAASVCLGTVCLQSSASPSPTLNCSGRKVLNGDEGYISDGPKHYLANSHCEWLIEGKRERVTILCNHQLDLWNECTTVGWAVDVGVGGTGQDGHHIQLCQSYSSLVPYHHLQLTLLLVYMDMIH